MANINVYVVVNLTINDADEYRIYEKGFFPILKKHNGSFVKLAAVIPDTINKPIRK